MKTTKKKPRNKAVSAGARNSDRIISALFLIVVIILNYFVMDEILKNTKIDYKIITLGAMDIALLIYIFVSFSSGFKYANGLFFTRQNAEIGLMLASILIACFMYNSETVWDGDKSIIKPKNSIQPDMLSTIVSTMMVLSIFIRHGLYKIEGNAKQLVIIVLLDVLFFAALFKVFASNEPIIKIFGLNPFPKLNTQTFFIIACLFSWIGIRAASGVLWIAVFILALFRFQELNASLGIWGGVFILLAVASLLLQFRALWENGIKLFSINDDFIRVSNSIKGNVQEGAAAIGEAGKNVGNFVEKKLPDVAKYLDM